MDPGPLIFVMDIAFLSEVDYAIVNGHVKWIHRAVIIVGPNVRSIRNTDELVKRYWDLKRKSKLLEGENKKLKAQLRLWEEEFRNILVKYFTITYTKRIKR